MASLFLFLLFFVDFYLTFQLVSGLFFFNKSLIRNEGEKKCLQNKVYKKKV